MKAMEPQPEDLGSPVKVRGGLAVRSDTFVFSGTLPVLTWPLLLQRQLVPPVPKPSIMVLILLLLF